MEAETRVLCNVASSLVIAMRFLWTCQWMGNWKGIGPTTSIFCQHGLFRSSSKAASDSEAASANADIFFRPDAMEAGRNLFFKQFVRDYRQVLISYQHHVYSWQAKELRSIALYWFLVTCIMMHLQPCVEIGIGAIRHEGLLD